jgi:putative transposase
MKKGYQRSSGKSSRLGWKERGRFEVVNGREVEMRLPLPMAEVWEEMQAEVERLAGEAGLKILSAVLEDEVRQKVGARYQPDPGLGARRWGSQPGYVVFGGQKIALDRPRVRKREGGEVELESYRKLQQGGRMQRAVRERMVCGLSSRQYGRAVESVLAGYGIARSSVSRHFIRATASELASLCERRLENLKLVAIMIDGIEFAGQVMIVALGLDEEGHKHMLGLWQGATENATIVKLLLEDLGARGLDTNRKYLFVLDGSKALRAAVERVFGHDTDVQRCQLHKMRNVTDHLPERCRTDWRRRMRAAYNMTDYEAAKTALQRLWRQLVDINPSAARSLEEGMEETLTVHRLSVGPLLRRTLASTNPIESCMSTVRKITRRVTHWQGGDHIARWTAAGLLEAEKGFRRIKGYRELRALVQKLNPSLQSQQKVA